MLAQIVVLTDDDIDILHHRREALVAVHRTLKSKYDVVGVWLATPELSFYR
jgi:hypothetical protein